jgi:hypothetical protein
MEAACLEIIFYFVICRRQLPLASGNEIAELEPGRRLLNISDTGFADCGASETRRHTVGYGNHKTTVLDTAYALARHLESRRLASKAAVLLELLGNNGSGHFGQRTSHARLDQKLS